MNRALKQLAYFLFFVIVIGSISGGLYFWLRTEATCTDGVKNQNEEGIDCGGICPDICLESLIEMRVLGSELVKIGENDYDFIAKINNPNLGHGSGEAKYRVELKDASGGVIKTINGEFHILPGQTRYIFISPIQTDTEVVDIEMTITDFNWQQLTDFSVGDIKLTVRRKEYTEVDNGTIFGKVEGVIFNDSEFDFDRVEVLVVLNDVSGDIVAAGTTNIRTLLSDKENFYEISWFRPFTGSVSQIEVQATTNAFENNNFLRRYGGDEMFQGL
jgi:hypothetical protein